MAIKPTHLAVKFLFEQNHTFAVPKYQRGYAWDDEAIEDFIEDISRDPDSQPKWKRRKSVVRPPHFFGTFVFYKRPPGIQLEIFDGQQRITAVSMLCAVLRELAVEQMNISGTHQSRGSDQPGRIKAESAGIFP